MPDDAKLADETTEEFTSETVDTLLIIGEDMENDQLMKSHRATRKSAALMVRRAFSRRAAINEFQAQHLCALYRLLVQRTLDYFEVETRADFPEQGWEDFIQLPEYGLFTSGVYACGFVCSDFSPTIDLEAISARPTEMLTDMTFPQMRHYMHTLMRSERAGYGYGSVLYEALRVGALEILCERLERDPNLYETL